MNLLKRFLPFVVGFVIGTILVLGTWDAWGWASDWRKCDTRLMITNPLKHKIIYHIFWWDHNIEEFKGKPVVRCGGEIPAEDARDMGEDFRLCPGRHTALFYILSNGLGHRTVPIKPYNFVINEKDDGIILSPSGEAARAFRKPSLGKEIY